MKRALDALAVAAVLAAPMLAAVGAALMVAPVLAACLDSRTAVTSIPETLTATTTGGHTMTLDHTQLTHAATILTVGAELDGVGREGVVIALMAALTESNLRMLANTSAYPDSADFPHDGNGSDHDSLGLFQMRPAAGWGTVAQLMDPNYQAAAFFGGPTGPNFPSPRGLLDVPGWQAMDPGTAAQSVEVSAYPDRYRQFQPVAEAIVTALTAPPATGGTPAPDPNVPETTGVVMPLPAGTHAPVSSPYGWRTDPVTDEQAFHGGLDFAAADGSPILAIADGVVTLASYQSGWGNLIVIEHTIDGQSVASAYAHMWDDGVHVTVGQHVRAGDHIGDVGSSGKSTGPHLHLEIRPGGWGQPTTDPAAFLSEHGAEGAQGSTVRPRGCGR